jgi:aspartyl-tRNA(Asn)/glutamyl-tRNA(Gln) amidotransferase subunit B
LTLLRGTLRSLGVSDVNMEEGSLRADANVSLRSSGARALGTKTELKNMNSFRFLERGVAAEIERQRAILGGGGEIQQETLHFDPSSGAITPLRSKEEAQDYRYFPEPDLVPIATTVAMLAAAGAALGELPVARAERYERELGLSPESAWLLAFRGELGDYFEQTLAAAGIEHAQQVANWLAQLVARIGEQNPSESTVTPSALAQLVRMVAAREVSGGAAREVLDALVESGGDPREIIAARGLEALAADDGGDLADIVAAAIAGDRDAAEQVRSGNQKAIGVLIGAVMRETRGRADGAEVTRLIHEQLAL